MVRDVLAFSSAKLLSLLGVVTHLQLSVALGDEPRPEARRHDADHSRMKMTQPDTVELVFARRLFDSNPHWVKYERCDTIRAGCTVVAS